jgi:phage repressor protein C with HTH and peptisase S24 domain
MTNEAVVLIPMLLVVILVSIPTISHSFPLIRVCGNSMSPTYRDGQFLVSTTLFKRYTVNSVYVFYSPFSGQIVIKRLVRVEENGDLYFEGDNTLDSTDSRTYGAVSRNSVIAKILFTKRRK